MEVKRTSHTVVIEGVEIDGTFVSLQCLLNLVDTDRWAGDFDYANTEVPFSALKPLHEAGLIGRTARGHCWGEEPLRRFIKEQFGDTFPNIEKEWL